MKYYPTIHGPCPDILLVARCLVPSARSLYAMKHVTSALRLQYRAEKGQRKRQESNESTRTYGLRSNVTVQSYMHHKLPKNFREIANRCFVAWRAVNIRPQNMMHDIGFKFFLGIWDPDYTPRTMSAERCHDILLNLYGEVRETLLAEIHEHRDSCLALGYKRPTLSGQVDLTTVAGALKSI